MMRAGWNDRKIIRWALLSTAAITATLLGLILAGMASGGLVVSEGHFSSRRMWQRTRDCTGVVYTPNSRHFWTTYCVGIPHGSWRCYEELQDSPDGPVEVRCR